MKGTSSTVKTDLTLCQRIIETEENDADKAS